MFTEEPNGTFQFIKKMRTVLFFFFFFFFFIFFTAVDELYKTTAEAGELMNLVVKLYWLQRENTFVSTSEMWDMQAA